MKRLSLLQRGPVVLLAGLLLGSAGALIARGLHASRPAAEPAATASATVEFGAWSWRDADAPAPLAADTLDGAIAAWLGMSAADGTAAGYAARADALRALLARLPAEAFPRLLTPLAGRVTRAGDDDRSLLGHAFDIWVERDPAAAARWVAALPDRPGLGREALLRQAAQHWSQLDAEAAAVWACALPDEKLAMAAAGAVLGRLAERDPARAFALASGRGETFLGAVGRTLFASLAKDDPAAALRTYGPHFWRTRAGFSQIRTPLQAWIAREPAAAFAWVLSQPSSPHHELAFELQQLVRGGPEREALATVLATMPGVPNRQATLGRLLFRWGADDAASAVAWLDSLEDRDLRTSLLEHASSSISTDHPERSLPLALAMPESPTRTQRFRSLLARWATRDPSAALAWIAEQDDPDVAVASRSVHVVILGNIARDEPATALAEWERLSDPATRAAAIGHIAREWGRTDPAAALQWLAARRAETGVTWNPDPQLVYAWRQQDPEAALRWAEQQGENARPAALAALAGTVSEQADRAATAELYTRINDPAVRVEVLTNHVREWHGNDPAAARAWLESHDALTPEQAAAILPAPQP